MAKKKKQSSKTLSAFLVLIGALALIWIVLTYLDETSIPVDTNTSVNADEQSSQNQDIVDNSVEDNDNENNPMPEPPQPQPEEDVDNESEPEIDEDTEEDEDEGQGDRYEDDFNLELDPSTLSNKLLGWSFKSNKEHKPTLGYNEGVDLAKYGAYYIVETNEKVIYLTFDAGYENGYTEKMLDTLKENNVQTLFFLTKSYIRDNPELATRMKQDGHLVGNHSVSHPSFPGISDEDIEFEIEETASYFEEITGYTMDPFFRPPKGEFSERTLYLTRKLGYRTIFWSLTYKDWDRENQPGKEFAYNHVMENYHPGAIPLLHAVSESNAEALDDILKGLKEEGYRFGNMYEIE